MRWKCCPLCTAPHDTWDCPKAQKIVESHTGLPFASPRKLNVIELIMEQTYGQPRPTLPSESQGSG